MSSNQNVSIVRALGLSRQSMLPVILQSLLGADDVIVSDLEFFAALKSILPDLKPGHLNIDVALENGLPKAAKTAVVCSRRNEMRLVRTLAKDKPECRVGSFTYDLLPLSVDPPFRWLRKDPESKARLPKVILMSPAYSDAEYVAQLISALGYAEPREYLLPAHVALAQWQSDFNALTVLKRAAWWGSRNSSLAVHLQSDVLFGLVDQGALNLSMLSEKIQKHSVKVIRVSRSDRLFQASIMAGFDNNRTRSPWHVLPGARAKVGRDPDMSKLLPFVTEVSEQDKRLDGFLEPLGNNVLNLTLEDVANDPKTAAQMLKGFLGTSPSEGADTLPVYQDIYKQMPQVVARVNVARRDLIDRLGLPHFSG